MSQRTIHPCWKSMERWEIVYCTMRCLDISPTIATEVANHVTQENRTEPVDDDVLGKLNVLISQYEKKETKTTDKTGEITSWN